MKLVQTQQQFSLHVSMLIDYVIGIGYGVTLGEAWRSDEQQAIYRQSGKTKAARSRHQDRLAVDLNLFLNGKYLIDRESYRQAAEFWVSLHTDNVAGYSWGWDANHFERKPPASPGK